jgi:glycine cleavage system regulatory protein
LFKAAPVGAVAPTKRINLVIDCKDRPGLTKEISAILGNLDLVVENMECHRAHVSSIGEAVFTAKLALTVPENMSGESVADEIEALADDVWVNVVA